MSKVEVDLNQLAAAVSAAILKFAQPQQSIDSRIPEDIEPGPTWAEKPKKKRGRPKKVKEEAKDLPLEPEAPSDFTAPAKRSDFVIQHDTDRKMAKRVPFKKKKRTNQWKDDLTLSASSMYNEKGEKIKYPQHTAPREPQIEQKYHCDNCGRDFMAFPSYIPPTIEGHQPIVRCHNCNTK